MFNLIKGLLDNMFYLGLYNDPYSLSDVPSQRSSTSEPYPSSPRHLYSHLPGSRGRQMDRSYPSSPRHLYSHLPGSRGRQMDISYPSSPRHIYSHLPGSRGSQIDRSCPSPKIFFFQNRALIFYFFFNKKFL